MRAWFWVLVCYLAVPNMAYAKKETLKVTSQPDGVHVQIYRTYPKYKILGECETPCTIEVKTKRKNPYGYFLTFKKTGYIPVELTTDEGVVSGDIRYFETTLKTNEEVTLEKEAKRQVYIDEMLEKCKSEAANDDSTNREAVPCVRIPPVMPPRMDTSGYCIAQFDVTKIGTVEFKSARCSNDILRRPTQRSVNKWIFLPKKLNGVEVASTDMRAKIEFVMTDDAGKPISMPEEP